MSKNVKIDGRELSGVTAIKALDTDTNGLVSFVDTSDADAAASDISAGKTAYVNGEKITGNNTGVEPNDLDGLVDGSITAFIMPTGKTKIAPYRFYQFVNLLSANLGGAVEIGNYAFDGCTKLAAVLSATLTNIGSYAFRNVGNNSGQTFALAPTNKCSVGSYAFYTSKISKVSGKFNSLGSYAFYQCSSLSEVDISDLASVGDYAFQNCSAITKLHMPIKGSVGSYAFYGLTALNDINLEGSVISSLGNYAFSRFSSNRSNPADNIIVLDFRNSTFTSIPQYGFGGDSSSSSYRNKYMTLKFPSTVTTIQGYAFAYTDNCDFLFTRETPPTLSATTAWQNATNYNIFVPYQSVNTYRTATNWTAQSSYIKGYALANTFEAGATLPTINAEGYGLTWYSDKACTEQVTTVSDENAELYCIVGAEKLAYEIKSVTTIDCTVVITDGVKNYSVGDKVLKNTVLTITGTPTTEGYIPYIFKVNNQSFTSGDTLTVEDNISVTALYWDGVNIPVNPIFGENSWNIIAETFKSGTASQFWNVGDTKEVELNDGNTYHVRIADMQEGRYNLADGSGSTNGVLEFVECLPNSYAINPSQVTDGGSTAYTAGGWAKCYMKNTVLDTTVWGLLPDDMRNAISEIALNEYSYTGESPRVSNNKLFLPAETEIFASRHNSAEGYQTGCVKYDRWDVYASITTSDSSTCVERQKKKLGQTSTTYWWLRSPYSGNGNRFCGVYSGGSYSGSSADYTGGVSPCFAI